ncbi:MAG: aminotransferase class I/II-fold pyridoxal phosphate-dependent enzyme [Clostridia bacterium]|nr:aminotransferase class I/II-fold pyridoxal phosphate-dependent enzyme [Clostridia bacterium]
MICFNCDYTEGAHPAIIDLLTKTNFEQTVGYGEDEYCEKAREFIKKECGRDDVYVQFLVGGTQANLTVISSALRPHQGAMAAKTGHINVHESGAIEATGHKVIALDCGPDGKLSAESVENCVNAHWNDETHEHQVQPKLVYISDSTENGAVYTRAELKALSDVCKKYGLYLYLDGARLGYAFMSPKNDVTLADLCEFCDAFYIGGTKVGAMMGEAVVITNPALKEDFRYLIKQKGGMFAKGRLLGIQFYALFENGLYWQVSKHAIDEAFKIANALKGAGVRFLAEPESNQIFPILKDSVIAKINEKYLTAFWSKEGEDESAIRICTSWATRSENSDKLIEDILALL